MQLIFVLKAQSFVRCSSEEHIKGPFVTPTDALCHALVTKVICPRIVSHGLRQRMKITPLVRREAGRGLRLVG